MRRLSLTSDEHEHRHTYLHTAGGKQLNKTKKPASEIEKDGRSHKQLEEEQKLNLRQVHSFKKHHTKAVGRTRVFLR